MPDKTPEMYEDEDFVLEFDSEKDDDWIRSPEVAQGHKTDKELFGGNGGTTSKDEPSAPAPDAP